MHSRNISFHIFFKMSELKLEVHTPTIRVLELPIQIELFRVTDGQCEKLGRCTMGQFDLRVLYLSQLTSKCPLI